MIFVNIRVKKLSTLQNMVDILGQPEETEIIDIPISIVFSKKLI